MSDQLEDPCASPDKDPLLKPPDPDGNLSETKSTVEPCNCDKNLVIIALRVPDFMMHSRPWRRYLVVAVIMLTMLYGIQYHQLQMEELEALLQEQRGHLEVNLDPKELPFIGKNRKY